MFLQQDSNTNAILLFKGIILFKDIAKEALEKAKAAHNGNLQLRNKDVTWELLEGDAEKEALKKLLEDQQELLKQKTKGPPFIGLRIYNVLEVALW